MNASASVVDSSYLDFISNGDIIFFINEGAINIISESSNHYHLTKISINLNLKATNQDQTVFFY